jgi:hypothetical protein
MLWMIWFGFAAVIFTISVMRSLRRASERRSNHSDFRIDFDRKPSDDFHDQTWLPLCTRMAQAAVLRLGRPLTEKERRSVWRARSVLALEVALKEIEGARDAQAVAELLTILPTGMNRPDPTGWCERDR